jgi:hypothetical protein
MGVGRGDGGKNGDDVEVEVGAKGGRRSEVSYL